MIYLHLFEYFWIITGSPPKFKPVVFDKYSPILL